MVSRSPRTMELLTLEERHVRFASAVARVGEHDALFGEPFALWTGGGDRMGGPATRAPAIVSYHADDFMDRLKRDLGDPSVLKAPDDARKVRLGSDPPHTTQKLFLPFHGWFHVVTSAFLCRVPGFPDRDISAADQETLTFVIRRVRTRGSVEIEEAWVPSDDPRDSSTGGWLARGGYSRGAVAGRR